MAVTVLLLEVIWISLVCSHKLQSRLLIVEDMKLFTDIHVSFS